MRIRKFLPPMALLLICFELLSTLSCAGTKADPVETKDFSRQFVFDIPDFSKVSDENADQVAADLRKQQATIKYSLIDQLRGGKLSDAGKSQVIRLLGYLHAYEAVPLLIENINFNDTRPYSDVTSRTMVGRGYVARDALLAIGRDSTRAILSAIAAKPDPAFPTVPAFDNSRINGFVEVLYGVEGEHYGLLKLQDRRDSETDPIIKERFQVVIDKYKALVATMDHGR